MGERKLLLACPDAVKTGMQCELTGFGKHARVCNIYKLPLFDLNEGGVHYRIANLYIAEARNPSIGCDFVLSDTMFAKTDTNILRMKDKRLVITFENHDHRCTFRQMGKRMSISTWAQDGSG